MKLFKIKLAKIFKIKNLIVYNFFHNKKHKRNSITQDCIPLNCVVKLYPLQLQKQIEYFQYLK